MPNIMEVASSTIRGGLCAGPQKKLIASDLANIEGRVLAWLAGESWKLQAFRDFDAGDGPDLYLVTAGGILGKLPSEVTKTERQNYGKVPELACGFGGGRGAFATMARAFGVQMSEEQVQQIVRGWRQRHPETSSFWYDLEDAALRAVQAPGTRIVCRKLVLRRDGSWLRIRLPSGRYLCYPAVAVQPADCWECRGKGCAACNGTGKTDRDQLTYMGVDQYTRKWKRISTYGGKLVENCTQAVARDVLAHNMVEADAAGYRILLSVHDELVTETLDTTDFTSEELCQLLSAVPPWADGLPLAAEGWEGERYRK